MSPVFSSGASPFAIAIAVLLACSPFSLAWHLYLRWFRRRIGFFPVYVAVLSSIILWSVFMAGMSLRLPTDAPAWLLSTGAGIFAGIASAWCDGEIVRRFRSAARTRRPRVIGPRATHVRAVQLIDAHGQRSKADLFSAVRSGPKHLRLDSETSPAYVVILAALEELVYRGLLVPLCFVLPRPSWASVSVVATVLLFGLSHIEFGWAHVAAKVPLGAMATAGVLITGTVAVAVVAHIVFNVSVFAKFRAARTVDGVESVA